MKAQKLKQNLLNDYSEILSYAKIKRLEDEIDLIINQVKIDLLLEQLDKKPIEIDTHGANDIPNV